MNRIYKSLRKAAVLLLAFMLIFQGVIPMFDMPQGTYALNEVADAEVIPVEEPSGTESGSSTEEGKRNERDGSKIEGIDIHWITPDSPKANNGTATPQDILDSDQYLFLATKSSADLEMKYQVEVSFSGQYDYAPGDIQITIPAKVWHTRAYADDGNGGQWGVTDEDSYLGKMDLSVPMAPSTRGDFNWQLINGNYVLTNTKTIGATSKAMFQFTITNLTPSKIVDMSECDPITVHCEVTTNKGNLIELTSNPIQAQIDTQAVITTTYKEGQLYEEAPSSLPQYLLANLPADDPDPANYLYIRWYTNKRHTANQAFSLDVEDTISDAYKYVTDENGQRQQELVTEGIFLGSSNYSGTIHPHGEGIDFSTNIHTNQYKPTTTGSNDTTVVLWSAYKKDDFYVPSAREPQIVYYFENEAEWILTESDADNGGEAASDGQKVTRVQDEAVVTYAPVQWKKPTGRFEVFKWTEQNPYEDWYYGYGLNQLLKGQDVSMRYHLKTVGFGYPWTSIRTNPADPGYVGEEEVKAEDFGNLGWRQTTEDFQTFFNLSDEVLTSRDFKMTYLQVTVPTKYRYYKATKPTWGYTPNGDAITASAVVYKLIQSGEYGYFVDSSLPTPDLVIEYQVDNEDTWLPAATANWGADGRGSFRFVDVADGITVDASTKRVYFPENTTDVRHIFVSNVFAGKSAEKCHTAAIHWDVYLGIDLKASDATIAIAQELFEQSDTPSTKFRNDVQMEVDGWVYANEDGTPGPGTRLTHGPESFYDISRATIAGASYGATLTKSIDFDHASKENGGDNDTENRRVILHYSATVTEKSNLSNRRDYDTAVAEGVIPAETKGIWYDLLPEGVTPMLDTIRLSTGETVTAKYTRPNFRETGRTLLVVEMDMTPTVTYNSSSKAWQDTFSIYFDAYIGWDEINDLGTNAVNYIAFESKTDALRDDTLGTIDGQQGEPDDPLGGMNDWTPSMPEDILAAMTGLDVATTETDFRFLYDNVPVNLNVNTSAVSGIAKAVKDDLTTDGWTQGLDGQEQVVVYEGHGYSYRLRVSSSESTTTKDMIIYDTIENYHIPDPEDDQSSDDTKAADFADKEAKKNWQGDWEGVGQWRGTLSSVDLSDFIEAGVAPVLYYSLVPDLTFADSTPDMTQDEKLALFNSGAYDITDGNYWQQAQLTADGQWVVPDHLSGSISAVAIDARKAADGSDFVLMPGQALSGYLRMIAPDDNSNPDVWNAKGAYAHKTDADGNPLKEIDWEAATDYKNNMFAFNNTRLKCVQSGTEAGGLSSNIMIRNDYTRVGILPGVIGVEKEWDDLDNWDNIRPEEITVTLMRKAVGKAGDYAPVLDENGQPLTVTLSEANDWKDYFLQVELVDEENYPYLFSFDEGTIEGYTGTVYQLDSSHYKLVNVHEKEKVSVSGQKQWNDMDNQPGVRPEAIRVKLLQNGKVIRTITVKADEEGNWSYDFGLQDKYAKGGVEHVYTIEEEYVAKYVSSSEDYTLLVNDWIPYGDLSVVKQLENATTLAKEKEFTFTIELYEEQTAGEQPKPLLDNYNYEIFQLEADGETWKRVSGGQLTCSSTFKLKGDQKIIIYELPSESTYVLTEEVADGFTLTGKVNDTGTIRAGQTCEASFTNTYASSGSVQFNAIKTQTGHGLNKNQHQFQIIDMNEGSATYGQPIRTAYSGTPTNEQEEIGQAIEAEAIASFGQLDYTTADDGKTFYYQVVEVDAGKPGYTYDAKVIDVQVTVTDNGDGTLTVVATNMETGEDVSLLDGSGMTYANTYEAEGELVLKAWKELYRRDLKAGEFSFELYRYDPDTGDVVGDPIATVQNDAEGNVVFPAIHFDQDDVSLDDKNPAKYYYLAQEVRGNDATVEYTSAVFVYEVTVYDNHDGTLSFAEGVQVGEREYEDCEHCNGTGVDPTGVEVAGYRSSGNDNYMLTAAEIGITDVSAFFAKIPTLCYTCNGYAYVEGDVCASCWGSGYQGGSGPVIYGPTNSWSCTYVGPFKVDTFVNYPLGDVRSYCRYIPWGTAEVPRFMMRTASCSTCSGTGQIPAGMTITGEASMPVFENELKPGALAVEKGVRNNPHPNQTFTFKVKLTGEGLPEELTPSITGAPTPAPTPTPTPVPPNTPTEYGWPNNGVYHATSEDLEGWAFAMLDLNTKELTIFRADSYNNATDPDGNRFYMAGYSRYVYTSRNRIYYDLNESRAGIPYWSADVTKVEKVTMKGAYRPWTVAGLFKGFTNLKTADLSLLDTSRCTSGSEMFSNCNSLESVNVYGLDTSNFTDMGLMFYNCFKLKTLDLSNFNTSKVTSLYWMFVNCQSLVDVNVSSFNTSKVTNMSNVFGACYVLPKLDLSSFNTSNATDMSFMFNLCYQLREIKFGSNFNTSKVTTMNAMFQSCYSLRTLDLSHFNTSRVTVMSYMFGGCTGLMELNIANFNTSRVTNFTNMFYNCRPREITIGYYTRLTSSRPEPYTYSPYDGNWMNVNNPNQVYSSYTIFYNYGYAGTWAWHQPSYKINFYPGEGGGSMPSATGFVLSEYTFAPTFYRNGYVITGFTDGQGNTYPVDGGLVAIPANRYSDNATVNLTAQWEKRDAVIPITNGEFTFTLVGNERITFEDLPAGTGYQIWEETPAGWVLVSQSNVSGTIKPIETSVASFVNEYRTNETQVVFRASKTLDDEAPEAGAFTFQLRNSSGNVLQTVTNSEGGAIAFEPITYTLADAGRSYYYTIREVAGSNTSIIYDQTIYSATVNVIDTGDGKLITKTTYRDYNTGVQIDPPLVFENVYAPGGLRLVKNKTLPGDINYLNPVLMSQNFIFEVTLTNPDGTPWGGNNGKVKALRWENDDRGYGLPVATESYDIVGGKVQVPLNVRTSNVVLCDIPKDTRYSVVEIGDYPGWTPVEITYSNAEGVIVPYSHYQYPESTSTTAILMNRYTHKGTAVLEVVKNLVGRTPEDGEFTFQLLDNNGNVIEETTNVATRVLMNPNAPAGEAAVYETLSVARFSELSYDTIGTYVYTIREVVGDDDTVEYSDEVITAVVRMDDLDGTGRLTPSIQYYLKGVAGNTITNTVKPGSLSLSKQVVSSYEPHAEQEFTFTLYLTDAKGQLLSGSYPLSDGSTLTVSNGQATIALKGGETVTINGLPDGASYSLVEAAVDGFTHSSTGTSGKIQANETAQAAFTNTYHAEGEYVPTAVKTLEGMELTEGQFSFQLLDGEGYVLETVTNTADGKVTFAALDFTDADVGVHTYSIVEVDSGAAGITYDETLYTITLTITDNGDGTLTVKDDLNGETASFTNAYSDKTSMRVEKLWNDEENALGLRPDSITVELYQNRIKYSEAAITAENGWVHTFADLPAFDADGVNYLYEVKEVPVPGYTTGITATGKVTTVTNTLLGVLDVSKMVEAGNEEQRFTFTVTLTNGDEPLTGSYPAIIAGSETTVELDENGAFTVELKHNETIRLYSLPIGAAYSVEEEDVPGYTGVVTEGSATGRIERNTNNGVTVTNTGDMVDFVATKVWEGGSGLIELTLYANGVALDPQPAYTVENDVYTFSYLPRLDENGEEIVYTAVEAYVDGYETIYVNVGDNEGLTDAVMHGGTILNRLIPKTEFQVTKVWEGGSGPIELTLYANGVKMDPQPLYSREGDVYTFTNLLMYDEEDNPIVYSAKEKYFDGYVTIYVNVGPYESVSNVVHNGGTIINRQIREADFQVRKIWRGLDDDERRPVIKLVLYCNGVRLDVPTPKPTSDGWYKYYGLPDHFNGEPAVYTVKEEPLAGYSTAYQLANNDVADYVDNGGTIINVKLPDTRDHGLVQLWAALTVVSLLALVVLVKRRKA